MSTSLRGLATLLTRALACPAHSRLQARLVAIVARDQLGISDAEMGERYLLQRW